MSAATEETLIYVVGAAYLVLTVIFVVVSLQ